MAYVTSIWTVQNYGHRPLFFTVQKNGCGLFKLLFGTVILDRQKLQKQKEITKTKRNFDPFGSMWSYQELFKTTWSNLEPFGGHLEQFGAIWSNLDLFVAI